MTSTSLRERETRETTAASALRGWAFRYGLIGAWAVVIIVFTAAGARGFLTFANFQTIFGSQAVLLILALALMIPATTGEFDVSVAGSLGIGMILTMYLSVQHGWPLLAIVPVVVLIGVVIGLLNAMLIISLRIMSLIATLATGTVLTGLGYFLAPGVITGSVSGLAGATTTQFLGIPLVFYYGLGLTIILWYIYAWTPLGRHLFFAGASPDVARLSGIRVRRLKTGALIASGTLSGVAGIMLAGTLASASPDTSAAYLFPAFAAAFLGSTAVTPGRFNPWGTFIAVFFLITGITGLELMGYVGWVPQVFYGASLIVAVAISKIIVRSEDPSSSTGY
jgi:ribose transport system permease protein